jgi:hypothetical protein
MYKRVLLVLGLLLISTLLLFGCSKNSIGVTAKPGENFTTSAGQTAQISGEDMTMTFNEVIGDSRAPQNVNTIWEGVANIRITMVYQGVSYSIVLPQVGRTEQAKDTFISYTLTYSLNPYPREGEQISPKDYRLTMIVTK